MLLFNIGDDCLFHMLSFLDPRDFCRTCLSVRYLNQQHWTNFLWKLHYIRKWDWKFDLMQTSSSDIRWMLLYPIAYPLHNGIDMSSAPDIELTAPLCIEFNGRVAVKNRSVKASHAFPPVVSSKYGLSDSWLESCCTFLMSFVRIVLSCANVVRPEIHSPKKYSLPVACRNRSLWFDARNVAYFEITILRSRGRRRMTYGSYVVPECIAIGLSCEGFCTDILPGWDTSSYGYHSDDGGIFHGSGQMLKPFGPEFGADDTVGCGLDLVGRRIFFTLNGVLIGVAFNEIIETPLFPTVGVDANVKIVFNFGQSPFQFDLEGAVRGHV